ncbi:hypothetical protein C8F04DRAFT_1158591 [Mycena alexandri]|uniref:Uncharacterized protein n=1 Tax=Mycena alexandri TaxID=1745969 RepID=A0AAD6RY54_9AGAR|nr:hypothetical protein C8F04DRAFT_1158591 [Mycena alexandri]
MLWEVLGDLTVFSCFFGLLRSQAIFDNWDVQIYEFSIFAWKTQIPGFRYFGSIEGLEMYAGTCFGHRLGQRWGR